MRGPKLFDHTNWKSKKRPLYTYSRCPIFTENIGEEQKKIFFVRDEAPHFL